MINISSYLRPGSVLIDASLQFNQDALKEELTDQLQVTSSIGDAIKQKMQRSKAPLFQDAEISISAGVNNNRLLCFTFTMSCQHRYLCLDLSYVSHIGHPGVHTVLIVFGLPKL